MDWSYFIYIQSWILSRSSPKEEERALDETEFQDEPKREEKLEENTISYDYEATMLISYYFQVSFNDEDNTDWAGDPENIVVDLDAMDSEEFKEESEFHPQDYI